MSSNTSPIWAKEGNVGFVKIGTTSAQTNSLGVCTGTGTDLMYQVFAAGPNGSFLQSIRIIASASTPTLSVAAVLRVYLSTVQGGTTGQAAPATTSANTVLFTEQTLANSFTGGNTTGGVYYLDIPVNKIIPAGMVVLVSQSAAQNTNFSYSVTAFGGNF